MAEVGQQHGYVSLVYNPSRDEMEYETPLPAVFLRNLSESFESLDSDDDRANENGPSSLQLSNGAGPANGQRRESFLYKSDSEYELTQPRSTSRHASFQSDGAILEINSPAPNQGPNSDVPDFCLQPPSLPSSHEDVIVTPFAQILQTLRHVRNNFSYLTKISSANRNPPPQTAGLSPTPNTNNNFLDDGQRLADETLNELDWCLEQLETMHTHRSVGDLASLKFRKMLGKELTAFEASSAVSGSSNSRVREFIINTYDREQEVDLPSPKESEKSLPYFAVPPSPNISEPVKDYQANYLSQIGPKVLSKGNSISIPECPEDIPISGVETTHQKELMQQLSKVDEWGINIFDIAEYSNRRPLTCVTYTILKKRNLLQAFQINPQTLVTYLMHLEAHYHQDVPYHNNIHAADVVQSAHVLLNAPVLKPIFNDLEVLATVFACAAHDVDHPGVSNQFLVSSEDQLAWLYNDESVLENHHISLAFQLLKDEGCNVFANLTPKQWRTFRKMAIDMVLATDMSKHMTLLADLKTMVETKKVAAAYELKLDNYSERIQVLKNMVHCADLSNPTKPRDYYEMWTNRITEEFFQQGDREEQLQLTISAVCERPSDPDQILETVARTQIGFISYVVHPLWETWDDLVSNANVQLSLLESNKTYYENQYNSALAKRKTSTTGEDTSQSDTNKTTTYH